MRYAAAVEFLLSFADLERAGGIGRAKEAFDLNRVRALLQRLGNPERGRHTVHVAGSKGKSSTAAMVQAIVRSAGWSTGLYTSPDLHSKRERVAINGVPLDEDAFAALVERLVPETRALAGEGLTPTTFELLTALAFLAFRDAHVEAQILEVGLGGRLDATNVVDEKDVCIITPLELEHTDILGDDLPSIAREKMGIARPEVPIVVALQPEPAARAVREAAQAMGAPLHEIATECAVRRTRGGETQEFALRTPLARYDVTLPLAGRHQMENAVVAVRAAELLAERTGLPLDPRIVRTGLAGLRIPGRMEAIGRHPRVIFDAAHTPGSVRRLAQSLVEDFGIRQAVAVVGMMNDKNAQAFAQELAAVAATVVATRPDHPRAADPGALARAFTEQGCHALAEPRAEAALETARSLAGDGGTVLVTGSFYLVAELRAMLLGLGMPGATSAA